MNSEYANLNAYDSIQVHGGSGYMLEYACQRLYRDARITSIDAAPPNNSFSKIWLRLIAQVRHSKWYRLPVCTTFRSCLHSVSLKFSSPKQFLGGAYEGTTQLQTVAALPHITTGTYSQMLEELEAGEVAANCVMSQLMLRDATKAPELFEKSMKVYLNLAEAEVAKHYNFVKSLDVEAMESYRKAYALECHSGARSLSLSKGRSDRIVCKANPAKIC